VQTKPHFQWLGAQIYQKPRITQTHCSVLCGITTAFSAATALPFTLPPTMQRDYLSAVIPTLTFCLSSVLEMGEVILSHWEFWTSLLETMNYTLKSTSFWVFAMIMPYQERSKENILFSCLKFSRQCKALGSVPSSEKKNQKKKLSRQNPNLIHGELKRVDTYRGDEDLHACVLLTWSNGPDTWA